MRGGAMSDGSMKDRMRGVAGRFRAPATHDLRQRVADLEDELIRTRTRLAHLESTGFPRRDLVPTHQHQTALVVWRPTQK